jgi:hypothetical protein
VRHQTTGELGYMVRRGGLEAVRLDRPMQEILRKPSSDWQPEEAHRPLAEAHVARVAFEADKALAQALGDHAGVRRNWADMSDAERLKWMRNGPPGLVRAKLRDGIYALLESHTRTR